MSDDLRSILPCCGGGDTGKEGDKKAMEKTADEVIGGEFEQLLCGYADTIGGEEWRRFHPKKRVGMGQILKAKESKRDLKIE